ncbi:hypothetical protein HOLleu_04637 [Holothuria leucospilota]|uniref:Uncharacterized protein n=1 Tax=Holothuria leucospilota TaxID=206669 RepID=A0A9Q1CT84_HOLLE|nr:hypothetical protein HOLleu_04637 [Holothuria leucospilota]
MEGDSADKPRRLINIRLADPFRALDRKCPQLTVPVILDGDFSSPIDYRAYIDGRIRRAEINVDEEYIKVQPGASSFQVHISIKNRGENRDDITIFLKIIPKYPISHPANTEIRLENGCTVDVSTLMAQKPSSLTDVSEIVTQLSTDDNFILPGHATKPSRTTDKSPSLELLSTFFPTLFTDPTTNSQTSMRAEPSVTHELRSTSEHVSFPDLIPTEQSTSFPLSKQPIEHSTSSDSTLHQEPIATSESATPVIKSSSGVYI